MTTRRLLLASLAAAPAVARAQAPWAPSRPVRIIVPYPPGGTTDALARPLAARLTEVWGVAVTVDNRGGAAGVVGADMVARAAPDGHTLLLTTQATQTVNGLLVRNLPYNVERSFTPITLIAEVPQAFVVPVASSTRTLGDLVVLARQRPISYASPGEGSAAHILAASFFRGAGVTAQHIPYRGAAPAVTDLLAGVVDSLVTAASGVTALARDGRLRVLAVGGDRRLPELPDVPSTTEAGFPGLDADTWFGLYGPAGLPLPIATRINADTVAAFADPAIAAPIEAAGFRLRTMSLDAFAAYHAAEVRKWFALVRQSGVALE
jgi:tripartite-type tricarboxylate transporter receptor subunit TctC